MHVSSCQLRSSRYCLYVRQCAGCLRCNRRWDRVCTQRTHCPPLPLDFPVSLKAWQRASCLSLSCPGPWEGRLSLLLHLPHELVLLITETTLLTEAGPLGQWIKLHPLWSVASAGPERFLFVWSWEDLPRLAQRLSVHQGKGPSGCRWTS